jgi:hypothetical protein
MAHDDRIGAGDVLNGDSKIKEIVTLALKRKRVTNAEKLRTVVAHDLAPMIWEEMGLTEKQKQKMGEIESLRKSINWAYTNGKIYVSPERRFVQSHGRLIYRFGLNGRNRVPATRLDELDEIFKMKSVDGKGLKEIEKQSGAADLIRNETHADIEAAIEKVIGRGRFEQYRFKRRELMQRARNQVPDGEMRWEERR